MAARADLPENKMEVLVELERVKRDSTGDGEFEIRRELTLLGRALYIRGRPPRVGADGKGSVR